MENCFDVLRIGFLGKNIGKTRPPTPICLGAFGRKYVDHRVELNPMMLTYLRQHFEKSVAFSIGRGGGSRATNLCTKIGHLF